MQAVYRSKKARLGVSGPGRNGRCDCILKPSPYCEYSFTAAC